MDPALAGLAAAALAFVAVAGAGWALANGSPSGPGAIKRARDIGQGAAKPRVLVEDNSARRRAATADALKLLADKQRSSRARLVSVKGRLAQAGLAVSETTFWAASISLGVVMAFVALIMQAPWWAIVGAAVTGGFGLPRWFLGMLTEGRQKKFSMQLAEGIDIIVRGVKSGLPLHQCLQIIAKESPSPLSDEFQRVCDGQAMGVPLDQNLQRLYENMPLPEVNFFNIVLIIQQKAGGNLAEALGNLSTVLRARRMLREKIKALSAEAKMSAMIIGAMPFLVALILAMTRPEYLMLLPSTEIGRVILMCCAASLATGIWIMRNMINFKF